MKRSAIIITGLTLVFFYSLAAFAFDPPHNEASSVNCGECHGKSLEIADGSPFWTDNKADTAYNAVCLRCHITTEAEAEGIGYSGNSGPVVESHAPGGSVIKCTVCHNNHEQDQIYPGKYNQGSFFIVKGTKDTGRPFQYVYSDPPDNTIVTKTVIPYSALYPSNGSGNWTDLEALASKTIANRGAMLVPDILKTSSRWPVYMVDSINTDPDGDPGTDDGTITIKGELLTASNLGIFYGQLIRSMMVVENEIKYVEFYDRTGTKSFVSSNPPYGICQVCHTQTDDWKNDGNPPAVDGVHAGMSSSSDCTVCHIHSRGLKHGGDGPTDICSRCHDSVAHPAHLDEGYYCGECHDIFNMRDGSNNILFKDGELLSTTNVCENCHTTKPADWAGTACLTCHTETQGDRAPVGSQLLTGNSHHVQGTTLSDTHCYQCHWEADATGHGVPEYHGGDTGTGDTAVNLVIWSGEESPGVDVIPGEGSRPETYGVGTTAVEYTGAGSHDQIASLNDHCLGCHSDQNNSVIPFGDSKTPKQYAWDGNSVDARYSQAGTTPWGKYSRITYPNVTPKDLRTKAFSAHGNAVNNQGGWNLNETWPNMRNGGVNIACFDCHNSHGSSIVGLATSYDDPVKLPLNGGILKDVSAGTGGYGVTYKPQADEDGLNKNDHKAGAALCFDCHLTEDASSEGKPWGYQSTFEASQPIIGYYDSEFLAPGQTGSQQRYTYKGLETNAGGHFGASSELKGLNGVHDGNEAAHQINGLCTPCHDPHGVSPTLSTNQQYAVPMLKGTWVTSPYKEDVAPANNAVGTVRDSTYPLGYDATPREGVQYHIDQNTFGANIKASVTGVTQTDTQFAGLCLNCHNKSNLTNGTNGGAWTSVDRIHESVKGWGANSKHKYTCSKCHAPHNGSALPRLMVTNCLDKQHKGRRGLTAGPVLSGSGDGDDVGCYGDSVTLGGCPTYPEGSENFSSGAGRFPGSFDGFYYKDWYGANAFTVGCHESRTGNVADQSWNTVTAWSNLKPAITSGPIAEIEDQAVLMHMDELSWNGTANEVLDSSGSNNHGTAINGANTVSGGMSGRAGSFDGANDSVRINYSPPTDNFTIEAWIKPTTTHQVDTELTSGTSGTSGQRYLFGADQRGTNGGAGISAGTNGISVYEHGNSYMPALAVYSTTISTTEWTHIAVVYSNRRPSIYINGALVRTGLQSTKSRVYAPTLIGGGAYGYFPGGIDEVAIYGKALTADDILLHYRRSSSAACGTSEAKIKWITDYDTTSYVDYGPTASYGLTAGDGSLVKNHSVTLPGLSIPATYHYRVRSSNVDGETVSGDYTFDLNVCPPVAPLLDSPTATAITDTTATLGANISYDGGASITQYGICWGTTASPGGNCSAKGAGTTGVFTDARTGLTVGTKLFYRGYATNSQGTSYSPDGSFYTEPATQAAGITFTSVGQTSMRVNWTRGSGDGVIVLMKQGSAVSSNPNDGTYSGYAANSIFGSGTQIGTGNYVVFKGTGTNVLVTGLSGGTTYHVAVYEYKGTVDTLGVNQGTNYKTPAATGNQVTLNAPPTLASPTAVSIMDTTATLGANITFAGGASITQYGTCWGTTASPGGNCSTKGAGASGVFSDARTGLTAGTKLFYRGYATNSLGTSYSPDGSFYTEPATQATATPFTSVGPFSMTVNWTRGSGDGVIVLMKQGSAVSSGPADGIYSGYTANSAFGSGTQLGSGNYVVYKGTGTSVTVTLLGASTTYHVAVYEYKGAVDTSGVNQGTNYKTPAATGNQATTALTPGNYSFTFNYTGAVQTLSIPAAAINIQFVVKGAGGGGGRHDYTLGENGQYGHRVDTLYGTSGITVSIYVGGGGQPGSTDDIGAAGGWGYPPGSKGGNGEYIDDYCWGYGGAGGGGSSAILSGATVLAGAAGGNGGYSGDWECGAGGAGGAGGGSDYPATTNPTGGGARGLAGSSPGTGGNGQVIITYDYGIFLPVVTSPAATVITDSTATLGANITSTGGASITQYGTCWGTTASPGGNCSTKGAGTTGVFTDARTSLTAGAKLFYRGYATNSAGTGYSPDGSFYMETATQASGVNFTSIGTYGMTVNWTRGSGDGVVVLMKQGSAVSSNPADGTYSGYTANAAFGSGTQVGTGNYVIYKGTDTSVAVTGLSAGTTYHVAVYEYAGTEDTLGINQGTNYKFSAATGSEVTIGLPLVTLQLPITNSVNCYTPSSPSWGFDENGPNIWAGPFNWGDDIDRTFIMFDTSAIPDGATVLSATLHLYYNNRDYLATIATTSVYRSTWTVPASSGTCTNIGSFLDDISVDAGDSFGFQTFTITPGYINRTGNTPFAILGDESIYNDDADPGYDRASSYLEVQYQ